MGGIQQTYNYYMSNYTSTQLTRYDTHKKSELRNICNIIKKLNKESPLYKVDLSKDMQRYVIALKESARNIKNVVSALSDGADDINCFQRKVAISSQNDIVSTNYIGDFDQEEGMTSFEIEVKQLATPQINLGNFLPSNQTTELKPGTYSFDLNTGNMGFEFQFGVNETDTNISIQRKLATLINDSNIGLTANILREPGDQSSLEIKSVNTGIINNSPTIFTISKNSNPNSDTALSYLGIDEINQYPENSSFLLNGMEKFSYSNTFTVGKSFEVTMKGISEEDNPATISLKADADTIADNVHELVEAYNSSLKLANEYASVTSYINKFQNEMEKVTKDFSNQFEPIGLMIQKDGSILVDKQLLLNAVTEEDAKENFSVLKDFKNVVNTKANKAMLDPMQYVNKTLITYKNPGKTFADPYVTSIYSGMLFNGYC